MKLATLCYIKHKGKTLMIHRTKKENDMHKDKWNGLGGKMEHGESPEDCVIREIKEECGLTIKNPTLKGIITFPDNLGVGETWYVFVFVANKFTGELIDSVEGDLEWVDDKQIKKLNLQEGDHLFFPWLGKPEFFSAKLTYKNEKLIDSEVNFY